MSSTVNIATGRAGTGAGAGAGAVAIPASASPNGERYPRNGTSFPGGKDSTKPAAATATASASGAAVETGRSSASRSCSRSRSLGINSLVGSKAHNHVAAEAGGVRDSANDPAGAGVGLDPETVNGTRRDKSSGRSSSISSSSSRKGARIEGRGVFLSGRRKPTGLSTIIGSDIDGHGGEATLVAFPQHEILLTGSGATAAPSKETILSSSSISSRSGFGSESGGGNRRRSSRRTLVEWFRDDGDDREGEKVGGGHGVAPAGSKGSSAAVGDAAVAGVDGIRGGRDTKVLGNAENAAAEAGARKRGGRKLADWVKGAGVDDSDGDTILSGNATPKSAMTSSPVAFSPANPPSVSRSDENADRGIIPKYPETQSPTTETQKRRGSSAPLLAEKAQSAGQETDSLDTAGEAAAAAAAVVADAPVVGDGSGEGMVDGFGDKVGDGAVAAGSEKKATLEREDGDIAEAAAATAVKAEEGVPEDRLAVDVGDVAGEGGAASSIGEVDTEELGTWKWAAPVDEEPAVDSGTVAIAVAPPGNSAGQDAPTFGAGTSKASVPASASAATASDTAGGASAAERYVDDAVRVPATENGRSVYGGVGRRVASFPLSGGSVNDVRKGLDRRSSGRSGMSVVSGLRGGIESVEMLREFGGNGNGGPDSGGIFGGTDGNGTARIESGGIGGILKGKVEIENGWSASCGMLNGSGGMERGGTGGSGIYGESDGMESGGTVSFGSISGSALGTGSGRRWRGDSNRALVLKTRKSLSVGGGSKPGLGSKAALDFKAAREGILTDGEEASELSPIGCEIAYMKQRRSTIGKGDKSTGGLGLGAWPNKSNKDADSAKVIYLGDIDFDAPGEATATDILVRQHRTRVRIKRVKDKATAKKKRKTRAKARRRIRNGKPLHPEEDEVEYMLTIGMMLGLRVAVGRQAGPLAKPDLTVEDFYQVDKYTFPPSGATGGYLVTPSHKLGQTFKFKDYAPKVFKKIREHFGVDKMRYMLSVAGNYNFLEFISNAKSGEFFFFSHDERFMIKTMKSSETKFLRRILPHYYEHVKVHPETFLVRFYGMYRVKMHHINRKVHFIVMNSVLDTYKEIHRTFDLKGSSLGRSAKPGEKVLKDNDLAEKQGKLHLGSQREAFLKVVRADSGFLARMKIMDYSLLTGIHDRAKAKPAEEDLHQSPRRYAKFFNFADEAENRTTPGFKRVSGKLPSAAPKAYSTPVKEDGIKARDEASVALEMDFSGGGGGEGNGRRNPRDGERLEDLPSSVVYLRNVGSSQSEIFREGLSLKRHRSRRSAEPFEIDAEAVSEAGIQYDVPASASELDGPSDTFVPSDEEPTSGGPWSATGTGTEEDTGGDYTEGDGEYETPTENAAGGDAAATSSTQEISLSRCSTAQENLSHWPAAEQVKGRGGPEVPRRSTQKRSVPMFRPTPEPRLAPPETGVSLSILRRADGGVDSETNGKRGRDIYFMGIIDILQEYNARKHGETFFKSLAHDRAEISCVDPQTYCQRFNDFLERHTN